MPIIAWIDLETGGFDANRNQLLEVGVIITDENLTEYKDTQSSPGEELSMRFHALVKPLADKDDPLFDTYISEWAASEHRRNGLLAQATAEGTTPEAADTALLAHLTKLAPKREITLAGSSVHFDYKFMEQWLPKSYAYVNYRIIDVSGIQLAMNFANNARASTAFTKPTSKDHRVFSDLENTLFMARAQWALLKGIYHE